MRGLGSRVWGLGVWGSGFRVSGFGMLFVLGLRGSLAFAVQGLGLRVSGLGFGLRVGDVRFFGALGKKG